MGEFVSESYFRTFGLNAIVGRPLIDGADVMAAAFVAGTIPGAQGSLDQSG